MVKVAFDVLGSSIYDVRMGKKQEKNQGNIQSVLKHLLVKTHII